MLDKLIKVLFGLPITLFLWLVDLFSSSSKKEQPVSKKKKPKKKKTKKSAWHKIRDVLDKYKWDFGDAL